MQASNYLLQCTIFSIRYFFIIKTRLKVSVAIVPELSSSYTSFPKKHFFEN